MMEQGGFSYGHDAKSRNWYQPASFQTPYSSFPPYIGDLLKGYGSDQQSPSREPLAKVERFRMDEVFKSQHVCSRFVIGISATAGVFH
jgi:hypothetical protein